MIEFDIPWPPSVNHYWRSPTRGKFAGRHLISKRGREYRAEVAGLRMAHGQGARYVPGPLMTGRLSVTLRCCPPDKRRRDLDNILKAAFDAMQHAGIYEDDEQVDRLIVERYRFGTPGVIRVMIAEIPVAPSMAPLEAEPIDSPA